MLKKMKAERWAHEDTLPGTLLLRMATLATLHKRTAWSSLEGSLPSSSTPHLLEWGLAKVLRLSKNKKRSGLLASQGSCPLLTILAIFFEIWGAGAAPAD